MEKKKFDLAGAKNVCEEEKLNLDNGAEIVVRTHIPYEEKMNFASEYAAMTIATNDDVDVCFVAANEPMALVYLIAKYYTNIDVTDEAPDAVYDFVINNNLFGSIQLTICRDFEEVAKISQLMQNAIMELYRSEHSLANMAKKILLGDINIENKEARELIEKLIDMRGALNQKEAEENIIQFGHKKTAGSVKTGGVNLNFTKK